MTPDQRKRLNDAAPALLAALREVEWGGTDVTDQGALHMCCPLCGGFRAFRNLNDDFRANNAVGHAPDCTLAAALAKADGIEV